MDTPCLTFRIAFFPFWRTVTPIASIIVGLLLLAARIRFNFPIEIPQIAVSLLSAVVSALVLVLVLRYFPVYVYEDGICCSDGLNRYRRIRWDSIVRLRPFNFLGLRYLRIDSRMLAHTLWLPLFLVDMRGFRNVVAHCAGHDHLLAEWLLEKGY